ncbi:hypothetical protein OH809_06325 [Streptomyces sp. NBC_00873]|uniref:hypothetical protein n=1 Tax=unclassified Streptomyces TaxID=2593676 RepID=UPI00386324E2|nr:hypothetical protein OH809_06325 [Streptomyces sp. NBC_00873]WTA47588.1 hypothetical protein OH821_37445 [Streptomyces sp. NBC_00842]
MSWSSPSCTPVSRRSSAGATGREPHTADPIGTTAPPMPQGLTALRALEAA